MEKTLSFIYLPDISGFTHFAQETEISHSKHIISELLEVILHSNNLELKVAEVEGDAIFFYRENFNPSAEELLDQVKIMFLNFHAHLKYYENYRICHCGACSTATELGLKFIIHLGTFTFTTVNKMVKPYGRDVILAHKLLKNNIEESEYLLLSQNTFDIYPENDPAFIKDLKKMREEVTNYDEIGSIRYRYFLLDHLHDRVKELPTKAHPHKFKNPVRYDGIINAPKEKVYETASNLEYRLIINKDASAFKFDKERVNRVGFVHECVINNRNISIETISNDFGDDKLVYGELVKKVAIARKMYTYTILENHGEGTKVYYEIHFEPIPVLTRLLSLLFRPFIRSKLKKSFGLLKEYCETNG
jgi:hypothetical protein